MNRLHVIPTMLIALAGTWCCVAEADITVVAFGDSTTAPRIVGGKPLRVYADILRDELPDYGIAPDVINSGVGGNNTTDATTRFNSTVRAHRPDTVVIQFGINDAAVDVWKNPPANRSRVSLTTYKHSLTTFVRTLKADGAQPILMTPNPTSWTEPLLKLYGKPPYDPNDRMGFNTMLVDYTQAVRDVAAAESVKLVDVYRLFLSYDAVDGQAFADLLLDGMHPNALGHRMIANELIGTIVAPCDCDALVRLARRRLPTRRHYRRRWVHRFRGCLTPCGRKCMTF